MYFFLQATINRNLVLRFHFAISNCFYLVMPTEEASRTNSNFKIQKSKIFHLILLGLYVNQLQKIFTFFIMHFEFNRRLRQAQPDTLIISNYFQILKLAHCLILLLSNCFSFLTFFLEKKSYKKFNAALCCRNAAGPEHKSHSIYFGCSLELDLWKTPIRVIRKPWRRCIPSFKLKHALSSRPTE